MWATKEQWRVSAQRGWVQPKRSRQLTSGTIHTAVVLTVIAMQAPDTPFLLQVIFFAKSANLSSNMILPTHKRSTSSPVHKFMT